MSYKVFWNKSAETDLNDIIDHIIENGGINTAFEIYQKIKDRAELLKSSPEQGRVVPELTMFTTKYREIIIRPWRLIYKIDEQAIKVLLILDGRRNTEDILYEKLIKYSGA